MDGCWDTEDVQTCYAPFVTTVDAPVRSAPSGGAPVRAVVAKGKHVGWSSTRNPGCIPNPPLRSPENGFAWVYDITGGSGLGGWVQTDQVASDPGWGGAATGPAGADFDCRGINFHCDGGSGGDARSLSGTATVQSNDVYLRYAPGSTAFRLLERGASVIQLCEARGWHCVQVQSSAWAPTGTRGWIIGCSLTSGC